MGAQHGNSIQVMVQSVDNDVVNINRELTKIPVVQFKPGPNIHTVKARGQANAGTVFPLNPHIDDRGVVSDAAIDVFIPNARHHYVKINLTNTDPVITFRKLFVGLSSTFTLDLTNGVELTTLTFSPTLSAAPTIDLTNGARNILVINAHRTGTEERYQVINAGSGGGAQSPWLTNIDADGFHLQDLGAIEFREPVGTPPAGTINAIYADADGMIFNTPDTDDFTFKINDVSFVEFSATNATFITNIIAGGAGDGVTNVGHIDFINNLATPAAAAALYSDGAFLKAKTNSLSGNVFITSAIENLNMNNFNITSTATPTGGNQFRIVFDGHDDSDTFISNIVTADVIHFESNASVKLEITPTGLLLGDDADFNANNLFNMGNIDFGATSATSGRIRLPAGGSGAIKWESVPAGFDGEMYFDNDFNWFVDTGGSYKFWVGGSQVSEFNGTELDMMANNIEMNNGDIIMGTGEITAGGAGGTSGIRNVGEIEFINNMATPGFAAGFYSDGTDMFVRTNSLSRNLSDVLDGKFSDTNFDVHDNGDVTKILDMELVGATTGSTMTFAFFHTANRTVNFPDATFNVPGTNLVQTWTAINTFDENIVGGGAGDGLSNVGKIVFTNNLASATGIAIYADATDLLFTANFNMNSNEINQVDIIRSDIANVSTVGFVRMGDTEDIGWRNASNDQNNSIDFSADIFRIGFDNVPVYLFGVSNVDLTDVNVVWTASGYDHSIFVTTTAMEIDTGATTDTLRLQTGGGNRIEINGATDIDMLSPVNMNSNVLTGIPAAGGLQFTGTIALSGAIRLPNAVSIRWDGVGISDIGLFVTGTDDLNLIWNSVAEYSFDATHLDLSTNYLQFDAAGVPSQVTGEPILFADSTNSDHLSIQPSSGSVIDLEAGGGGGTSFIGFTADANLNMGAFDILTTTPPATNIFRLIFDGDSDSDTYISNSTGASDRINVFVNGSNVLAFVGAGVNLFDPIDMNGNLISEVGSMTPVSSGGAALGSASLEWDTVYSERYRIELGGSITNASNQIHADAGGMILNVPDNDRVEIWTNGAANSIGFEEDRMEFLTAGRQHRISALTSSIDIVAENLSDSVKLWTGTSRSNETLKVEDFKSTFFTDTTETASYDLQLVQNNNTPANGRTIGNIHFIAEDSGSVDTIYGIISVTSVTITNGAEQGLMQLGVVSDAVLNVGLEIQGEDDDEVGIRFYGIGSFEKQQTITGSRGGNAALADLLQSLENFGLINDLTGS